jgi:hypothetical protein
MSVSEFDQLQIRRELLEMSARRGLMHTSVSIAGLRISKLRDQQLYLETTFLNAQIIEKWLKLIIGGYASRRRILELLGQKDIHANVKLELDEEETLGHLIGLMKKLRADQAFLRRLGEFNNLRKEAVHHLFDGGKELAAFDEQAKEYFVSPECNSLYDGIVTELEKVETELQKIAELADAK